MPALFSKQLHLIQTLSALIREKEEISVCVGVGGGGGYTGRNSFCVHRKLLKNFPVFTVAFS